MPVCLVALGSNLGNRLQYLQQAIAKFSHHPQIRAVQVSRWYESLPIGGPAGQPNFLNGVLRAETSLSPIQLFQWLQGIERRLDRKRNIRWNARTIDLDLLLYGSVSRQPGPLTLPHPRMTFRPFVLAPAVEIAPEMIHPVTGWTIKELLANLNRHPPYVALAGVPGVGKSKLLHSLARLNAIRVVPDVIEDALLAHYHASPIEKSWETERFLLCGRSELLHRRHFTDHEACFISKYWWSQSMAYAELWMPDQDLQRLVEERTQCRGNVIVPTVVMLLRAPVDKILSRVHSDDACDKQPVEAAQLHSLAQSLHAWATSADEAPVVPLDITDPNWLNEATAVIEAIRCSVTVA